MTPAVTPNARLVRRMTPPSSSVVKDEAIAPPTRPDPQHPRYAQASAVSPPVPGFLTLSSTRCQVPRNSALPSTQVLLFMVGDLLDFGEANCIAQDGNCLLWRFPCKTPCIGY